MAKGVVAAGHAVTAEAAAEVLEEGGNAFDAALAGLLACLVPEVVLASLGGGGFLMAHIAETGETRLYDFFADTPRVKRPIAELDFFAIHADFGPATQEFHIGAGASAVPGFVPGLFAIHGDLCRLDMGRIVAPAVRAAREGVEMSPFHAYLFTVIAPILTASPEAAALFAPGGRLLGAGDIYRNPELASTLEALAREGADLFIHGEVGRAMVRQSEEGGGHLTLADLEAYRVARRRPLERRYRGHGFALNPAPAASGPLIAFSLALLKALVPEGREPEPVELARVMAATNAAREETGGHPEALAEDRLLARHLAALDGHAPAMRGTTHISVIDADGNAAAATISNGEGNGLMVGPFGFMLNNMLGEEDICPEGFHRWAPGRRMSSMMAPTLMRAPDGALVAMGSGGSNRIRSAILQVAARLAHGQRGLVQAVAAPRLHVEKCGTLSFEHGFSEGEEAALRAAFDDPKYWPEPNMFFGGVHTVRRHGDGRLEGAGDPRRAGVAMVVS